MLASVHSWLDRHRSAADAALAAVLFGFALSTFTGGDTQDPDAAEIVFTVLLIAPLVARRRAPAAVFAVVMLVTAAELIFVDVFIAANVATLFALYTLVAWAPRRLAAIGLGVALAGTIPFALHFAEDTDGFLLTWVVVTIHIVLAAALGDSTHARLRQRRDLEDRTRLLAAERDQRAAIAAAEERARIAREVHDVVAHSLSVVIAQADGGRYAAAEDPEAATAALRTISTTAREAQAEMRRALGVLRDAGSAPLQPQPDIAALPALVERMGDAGLVADLVEEGERVEVAPGTGMTVYRVTQEALTNVLKHAGRGTRANVRLSWQPDRVTVVVRDDGPGSGSATDGLGRGLNGMRERVEPRGGTVTAGPDPAGGFAVRAEIPVTSRRRA